MSGPLLREIARAVIDGNRYMVLGTAGELGEPWVSPVWFATADLREFFWASNPEAAHSRNIAANPAVSVVIFDSQVTPGTGQAVYMSAAAEELSGADLERGIGVFSRESLGQGMRAWTADDRGAVAPEPDAEDEPRPPAYLRLYRATASEHFILDPGAPVDRRVRVTL